MDFGARMLDVRLGKWWSIDPQASRYPGISTYAYVAGNPIVFIDPEGETIYDGKHKVVCLICRKKHCI